MRFMFHGTFILSICDCFMMTVSLFLKLPKIKKKKTFLFEVKGTVHIHALSVDSDVRASILIS